MNGIRIFGIITWGGLPERSSSVLKCPVLLANLPTQFLAEESKGRLSPSVTVSKVDMGNTFVDTQMQTKKKAISLSPLLYFEK
jgi:hypothetical protein